MHVPILFGVLDADGTELTGPDLAIECDDPIEYRLGASGDTAGGDSGNLLLHLRSSRTSLRLPGHARRPRVSLLRGFSAPVRMHHARPLEELAFLATHDGDGFARWDALQTLLVTEIHRLMDAGVAPGKPADTAAAVDARVRDLFATLLQQAAAVGDVAEQRFMLAAMLSLPDENYLLQQFDVVDVGRLCDALDALRLGLAATHGANWQRVYEANVSSGAYDPAAPAMAKRSLKHVALDYLCCAADGDQAQALLDPHYRRADNLTDRQAALVQISRHPGLSESYRGEILADFYERWQHEALVVNVWFGVQAASPLNDAAAVRALTGHRAFDPRNPNKLRSVYGAFSRQNHRRFHAPDGSGYGLLAEAVLDVDGRNPSMASSLSMPLTRWRRFDPPRSRQMRQALEGLAAESSLSRDLYEVVTKSLAEPATQS